MEMPFGAFLFVVLVICALEMTAPFKWAPKSLSKSIWPRVNRSELFNSLDKSPLELCDENVSIVMEEIRNELGTIFGYDAKSREVGISGQIELVEIDGPAIVVALNGRFWHATDTVMARVESFVRQRIPEVTEVVLSQQKSTIVDDNRLNTGKLY